MNMILEVTEIATNWPGKVIQRPKFCKFGKNVSILS